MVKAAFEKRYGFVGVAKGQKNNEVEARAAGEIAESCCPQFDLDSGCWFRCHCEWEDV